MGDEQRQRILDANKAMAKEALRVIALAYRVEKDVPDHATPETVEHDLIVLAGVDGAHEDFLDDRAATESIELFVGVNYNLYALGARDFIVTASAMVFPSVSVKGRVRTEMNIDVRKELWEDFYVPIRGFFSSDNTGSQDDEQGANNDYGVTPGIGYSW